MQGLGRCGWGCLACAALRCAWVCAVMLSQAMLHAGLRALRLGLSGLRSLISLESAL